jgi:tRNA(Arg) A34 adenosine deaminase TadA
MPIRNDDLVRVTQRTGSLRGLKEVLQERRGPRVAFFKAEIERTVYYAFDHGRDPLSPVVQLFLSGVHIKNEVGTLYRNYTPRTEADVGIVNVCAGLFYRDDGQGRQQELLDLVQHWRERDFVYVTTVGLPDLFRDEYPLPNRPAPNIDVTRETSSNPQAHDGFHTVHRLYMAAAFRILRAKQQVGGREGVAALLVDGNTGDVLSWGLKDPTHPALHAESSALFAWGRRLPANARVYSTLKPCKMCAGLISTLSGGHHRVYYGQSDPALAAQGTALDEDHSSRLLDGRRRVAGVRGIVPIYHDRSRSGVTLAEMLDDEFQRSGRGSVIDFATSNDARDIYHRSDRMLEGKIAKYADDRRNDLNRNVWAVLSHLTTFLNDIGVPTRQLAGPT